MATRRTQVGLRRRGPRLIRLSWGFDAGPTLAIALIPFLLAGCFGLSQQEQQRFAMHQENSQEFYSKGSYRQAVQQAEMALTFDESALGMRLMRGYCLTKLGKASGNALVLDEAILILEGLTPDIDDNDYRVWLGIGQAHLARAFLADTEIGRMEWQLSSDFLDEAGRRAESQQLEQERDGYAHHLKRTEEALRRVLNIELQEDNTYALIELALVLNLQEGREKETLEYSDRAVRELMQANKITNNTLQEDLQLAPDFEASLEKRIEKNLHKERLLRSNSAHIYVGLGDDQAALETLNEIERRQLMEAGHYEFRATICDRLGLLDQAVRDLENYLKLRAQVTEYDEVASETFDRIDQLVARGAQPPTFN